MKKIIFLVLITGLFTASGVINTSSEVEKSKMFLSVQLSIDSLSNLQNINKQTYIVRIKDDQGNIIKSEKIN